MGTRVAGVVLALVASTAEAQIIQPSRSTDPSVYVGAGVGILQTQTIDDYATGSTWNFGTTMQWRVAAERPLRNGGGIGIAATLAKPTLEYDGSCGTCDASANLWQVLALFRMGGRELGFSQVIELTAGVTAFSAFRQASSGAALEPTSTVLDPTFAVGYGFGYGFSQKLQLVFVQEAAAMLHRRENAPAGANTLHQAYVTRIGLRMGLR